MDTRIRLITLLCIGWFAYTNNSGLPLELTQFQSGDNVTLVCSAINTTINMSFTRWYLDEELVVLSTVVAGHDCTRNTHNDKANNTAYRYDLYTSNNVSVSCGYLQHNITLTQDIQDGTVWRCEDQRNRVSNNLTLDFKGATYKTSSQLTDSATTLTNLTTIKTTSSSRNDNQGLQGTTYKTSSQLTDSVTTLGKLTTIKISTAPSNDNQDDAMHIAAGTGGGIFILIIIVICVCVVRTRRKGNVTQAISDADNGAEVSENPLYVTYQVEPVDNKVHFNDNTPEHKPALGGAVDVGDLYAVPDKSTKHQSAVAGAVNIGDLYAVPDMSMKTKNGPYSTWSEADSEYSEI